MNTPKNYLAIKIDYSDSKITSIFDELSLWSSYFGRLLLDHVDMKPNIKLLDVACGTGFPLFELAHRLGPTCTLTGIDIWEQAVERARFKQTVYNLSNVHLILGDAAKMPFTDHEFDMITTSIGYNNFEDPQQVFNECFRVLRPGGKIFLTSNVVGHMSDFYRIYEQVLKELNKEQLIPNLHSQEQHRGTIKKISEELQAAGFKVIKVVEDQFSFRYVDAQSFFSHALTVFGFLEGWRGVVDKKDEEVVFEELETTLNILAAKKGEIKMIVPMVYIEAMAMT